MCVCSSCFVFYCVLVLVLAKGVFCVVSTFCQNGRLLVEFFFFSEHKKKKLRKQKMMKELLLLLFFCHLFFSFCCTTDGWVFVVVRRRSSSFFLKTPPAHMFWFVYRLFLPLTHRQDSHCAVPDLDAETSFFAVFDGHGGKEVALYAGRHLPQILKETKAYKERTDLKEALVESFMKIDEAMKDKTNAQELTELSGRRRFREEEDAGDGMSSTGGGARGVNEAIRRALKERLLAEGTPSEEVDLIIPSLSEDDEGDDDVDDGNAEGDGLNKKNNGETKEGKNDNDVTNSSDKTMTTEQPVLSTSSTGKKKFVPLTEEELNDWEGPVAGAAAVSVALRNGEIICANAGDSRAVLCRDGKSIDMSRDHKPTDEDECERIVQAGGFVADGRVNGSLALSRAIGDFEYKRNNVPDDLPPESYCVTANPEVKTFNYDQDKDEFIIIACDGVWDVMTSQECVDFVRERLCYSSTRDSATVPPQHLSKITEELCDACCATDTRGSGLGCDNISAIIVQFLDSKKCKETTEKYNNMSNLVDGGGGEKVGGGEPVASDG